MKIEQQVCTLEQAKQLKALGIEQNTSMFIWYDNHRVLGDLACYKVTVIQSGQIAAFTVAELGVMCNSETYTCRTGSELSEYANWEWADSGNENGMGVYCTEAEARAAMLIYLLENNLTTVAEVNKRLTN